MKNILTYGTFDTFHYGHMEILLRASALGKRLYVGVSSDKFNEEKGKVAQLDFKTRCQHVSALTCVYDVFAEENWDQKHDDIQRLNIDTLVMGSDWTGKFDFLLSVVEVLYLPRTLGVSSTEIRSLTELKASS